MDPTLKKGGSPKTDRSTTASTSTEARDDVERLGELRDLSYAEDAHGSNSIALRSTTSLAEPLAQLDAGWERRRYCLTYKMSLVGQGTESIQSPSGFIRYSLGNKINRVGQGREDIDLPSEFRRHSLHKKLNLL